MPSKKTNSPVPAHECVWYPLAHLLSNDPPHERVGVAVYACGAQPRCIKTMSGKEMERKRTKPQMMESPYEQA
jgi:hypothetical protein